MSKWCIGDIHGCFLTMLALIKKVREKDPEAEFIFTGDFVDRGPKSKEVLEYILPRIRSGEFKAVRGNHEEIMYNGLFYPRESIWLSNGGRQTINSYDNNETLMKKHATEIIELPLYIILDEEDIQGRKLLISHAFCGDFIEQRKTDSNYELFNWNRILPKKLETGYFNITGHNITGHLLNRNIKIDGYDEKTEVIINKDIGYACIDTGAFIDWRYETNFGGKLTAISFPNLEIIQQENID